MLTSITLEKVRSYISKNKIDGILVGTTDAFCNEYSKLSQHSMYQMIKLQASAGFAIATKDSGAIIVDGRYTIAAHNANKDYNFDIIDLSYNNLSNWCKDQNIKCLGLNTERHTINQVNAISKHLKKHNISIEHITESQWQELSLAQKDESPAKITLYPLEYAGQSSQEKIAYIENILNKGNIDYFVTNSADDINWLLNIRGHDIDYSPVALGTLIVNKNHDHSYFPYSQNIETKAKDHLKELHVAIKESSELPDYLNNLASESKNISICSNASYYSYSLLSDNSNLSVIESPIANKKLVKNNKEIELFSKFHIIEGLAFSSTLAFAEECIEKNIEITELDIMAKLEEFRKSHKDYEGTSFQTIAGINGNGAIVHYHSTQESNKPLNKDSILLLDAGAQYYGSTTDATRTWGFKDNYDCNIKEHYSLVLKGMIRVLNSIFPEGIEGNKIDILARYDLMQRGLDYQHGTGHGVGNYLHVHEGPAKITKDAITPINQGYVLSVEPGYYLENNYGIRIENLVHSVPSNKKGYIKFDSFTMIPISTSLIDIKMLSKEEIDWINSYNKLVEETLSPLANEKLSLWLKNKCTKIG